MQTPSYTKVFQIEVTHYAAEGDEPAAYVAFCEELGLSLEADTLDALVQKIRPAAIELFELNVLPHFEREESVPRPAFNLNHLLGISDDGSDLLSGAHCVA
ncbi:MAG: hypothetical protein AAFR20_05695 [Pseudomonadota bacterium]